MKPIVWLLINYPKRNICLSFEFGDFRQSRGATHWAIIDASGKSVLLTKKSQYTESVTETTYSAFVAAHSRLIATFSHDIAQAIKSLSQYGSPPPLFKSTF
jgi:ABC-type transport auxiliary lipoprotein component